MKVFDRLVTIQKIDEETENWDDVMNVHASINKSRSDNEYLKAGAIQDKRTLTFEIRYFNDLEKIAYNMQLYRLKYNDVTFNIIDFDDYMLKHKTVKITGVSI